MKEPDCAAFYETEVIALAQPLVDYCKEHKLPMFIAVRYLETKDGPCYGAIGCGGPQKQYPKELQLCQSVVSGHIKPIPMSKVIDMVEFAASAMQHMSDPDLSKN